MKLPAVPVTDLTGATLNFEALQRADPLRFVTPSGDASGALDTANISAAIRTLAAQGGTIRLGPGAYYTTGGLFDSREGVHIQGAGKWRTVINVTGSGNTGLNFTSNAGTGGVKDCSVSDLQVNYTGSGTTALRVWNCQSFNAHRCIFYSDKLACTIQGSFIGTFVDCEFYVTGAFGSPIAPLWVGSGRSAPYTGGTTLSGCGGLSFHGCIFESFNGTSAVIVEDNTYSIGFYGCQWASEGGGTWAGVVQLDGGTLTAVLEDCYQEQSHNAGNTGVDIAIGVKTGNAGNVSIRDYNSTGSAGQAYAFDVKFCRRLHIDNANCIAYGSGVTHFGTGMPAQGGDDTQQVIELADASGAGTMYVDADGHIPSTYRGPIIRRGQWRHLQTREVRLDATAAAASHTFLLCNTSNPTSSGGSDPDAGLAWFWLDPADWGCSPLRVRGHFLVNSTAPASNFNFGLVPPSGSPSGGAGNVNLGNGSFIGTSGSVSTPAAGSMTTAAQIIGSINTAGWYALAVTNSAAFTANSSVAVTLRLEYLS